jgi:hypothetical protein
MPNVINPEQLEKEECANEEVDQDADVDADMDMEEIYQDENAVEWVFQLKDMLEQYAEHNCIPLVEYLTTTKIDTFMHTITQI